MRNKISFMTFLLIAIPIFLYSQDTQLYFRNQTIEVYGTASVKVKPDIMKWEISIDVDNDNVSFAKKNNDKSTLAVLNVLKSLGINEKDIQTQGLKITKNYVNQYSDTKKYSASNSIWLTINDINMYDNLTDELMKIEYVFIRSTNLEYLKAPEVRIKARSDAIDAAKRKAEEMAGALGLTIGKTIHIEEIPIGFNYYPYSNSLNNVTNIQDFSSSSYSTYFSEGLINIEAKVKIIFELK